MGQHMNIRERFDRFHKRVRAKPEKKTRRTGRGKPPPDYAAELQRDFDRWDHLSVHGCNDPCWADGVNMNLKRNHILIAKRRMEGNPPPGGYPEIYCRDTPPKVDGGYMARAGEIRGNAKKSLEMYRADLNYIWLCGAVKDLSPTQIKSTFIDGVINTVGLLEKAIEKGDLVAMRLHEKSDRGLEGFANCAGRVKSLMEASV